VSGQSLSVYADGERITSTPVDIRVRPGALRLLMPPSDLTS
jgi:diacylglycerol kinase family enzyme